MRFMKPTMMIITALGLLGGCHVLGNMQETTRFEVQGERLLMNGDINSRTYDQFMTVMADNPQITVIVEQDMPGSMDDDTMIKLAYKVRALGLNTYLEADSEIYSGAVDLFLAGVQREAEPGAVIGVHSWSGPFGVEAMDFPRGAAAHEQNRKYIEDMLGQDDFYWFTIEAAPADGLHIMTRAEVARFGLLTP